jgi:hypothetical protein
MIRGIALSLGISGALPDARKQTANTEKKHKRKRP